MDAGCYTPRTRSTRYSVAKISIAPPTDDVQEQSLSYVYRSSVPLLLLALVVIVLVIADSAAAGPGSLVMLIVYFADLDTILDDGLMTVLNKSLRYSHPIHSKVGRYQAIATTFQMLKRARAASSSPGSSSRASPSAFCPTPMITEQANLNLTCEFLTPSTSDIVDKEYSALSQPQSDTAIRYLTPTETEASVHPLATAFSSDEALQICRYTLDPSLLFPFLTC
jgi:hypothetical protein